jgi:hypothetical protein
VFGGLQANATHCLDSESVEELKTEFPIVILGKVISKVPIRSDAGDVKIKIKVLETLKGRIQNATLEGFAREWKGLEKPKYTVGATYAFGVDLKNDVSILKLQPQGCDLFLRE